MLSLSDPKAFESHLARTLNNLGSLCRETCDFVTARVAFEKSLDIRERLSTVDPQIYEGDLAATLGNFSALYRDTQDFSAARGACEKARDIYARLAATSPQRYEGHLAITLNNLGQLYKEANEFTAARKLFEEARDINVKLVSINGQKYEGQLARTLNNIGLLCVETRDFAAARVFFEKSLYIRKKLSNIDPQMYQVDLANTLHNISVLYFDMHDFSRARVACEEARDIYAKLAAAEPQVYANDLALTLVNLGGACSELRDMIAARDSYQAAHDILAKLSATEPERYESNLANASGNLGCVYARLRDFDAAYRLFEEARAIHAKLAIFDPQTYEMHLARTLTNFGCLCFENSDLATALGSWEKAINLVESRWNVDAAHFHLGKGPVGASYRLLLSENCGVPTRAFALLSAQRAGQSRSSAITASDLAATQSTLAEMGRRRMLPYALLAPTSGIDTNTMTLGLITGEDCQWFRVASEGWESLFLGERGETDQRLRRALARDIWKSLPSAIQAVLCPGGSSSHEILISGDPFWSAFPWELLRFGDEENDHLGLHKALPRCGSVLALALQRQFAAEALGSGDSRMAIVAPHTTGDRPLDGVEREVEALETLVPAAGGVLVVKEKGDRAHDRLMIEAIQAKPSILYFSGHGVIINNEELLVLHRDPRSSDPKENITYFGADNLRRMASDQPDRPLLPHAPLIVMNSCMTGGTRDYGGFREDLVYAFLHHGAGAVIATALPILDDVGEALGNALFDPAALVQPTVGSLVVEARRQLARRACADIDSVRWGAWAMVHLHGNAIASPPLQVRH
jgi:hypothetical protein